MYAIVDIETTGLQVQEDKITEIAIFLHDGNQVIKTFHSLINPERFVPEFITKLTGINNDMLIDAPKFYEIAKDIVEMTEGKVFVAHNAHFDYTFLKNEFKNLGFNFQRKTLCTVRLSRKIIPKLPSYSLGNICNYLNINHLNKHRAKGDAEATSHLFTYLLNQNEDKLNKNIIDNEIKVKTLPPKISYELFDNLPEETGIYYFHNEEGDIIYIGKSKNIKKRVASHFSTNLNSKKSIELKNQVADISFELTGSELIALLLESDEIKKHKPKFNKAQRRSKFQYAIFLREGQDDYLKLHIEKINQNKKTPLYLAQSLDNAKKVLYNRVKEYDLCLKLCSLYPSEGACFDYQIKLCQGACIGEEKPKIYNQRVKKLIHSFNAYHNKSFLIRSRGRSSEEYSLVCVENGRYLGWAYVDKSESISHFEEAKSFIKSYQDNKDVQKIIWAWIKKNQKSLIVFD